MKDNYNDENLFEEEENNSSDLGLETDYSDEELSSWSEMSKKYDTGDVSDSKKEQKQMFRKKPSHYLEDEKEDNSHYDSDESYAGANQNIYAADSRKIDKGLKVFLIISSVIIGIIVMVVGASIFASFLKSKGLFSLNNQNPNKGSAVINTVDVIDPQGTKSAEEIYQQVAPSIVGVITYNPSAGLVSSAAGQGSGIIMTADGYIVTNSHVIGNSNKYTVTVVTSDRKEYPAKVVGYDTRTDLAVLKIDASGLKAAEFGNSDQLAVGARVLAIGNPGGLEFYNTLTSGLISALNRSLGANSLVKYIQTDAAINPGNSGGALLNMYGQVIGVNVAKASDYEGIGFAIPVNTVKTIVDSIVSKGYVAGRVKLGIVLRPLSAYEAKVNDVPQGLLVMEISNGSNVASEGLKVGDIITKFDGVDTTSTSSLYSELSKHNPGDSVKLTVYRLSVSGIHGAQGSSLDINVTLVEDKGESQ